MSSELLTLIAFVVCCVRGKTSLFKLEGEVRGQEFAYYKIMHPGNLLLVLESLEGDSDVYVSEKNPSPSFHPESYDFHSATCGTDSVYIPKSVGRPVAVGIYGYTAHNKFALEVFQVPDANADYPYEDDDTYKESLESAEGTIPSKKDIQRGQSKIKKKLKNLPSALWPLLELIEMFFL